MVRNFSNTLICKLCAIWLIVDSVNGFFMNIGMMLPISQSYKLLVLLLMIYICIHRKIGIASVMLLFFYIAVLFLHLSFINEDASSTFIHLSKFVTTIFSFLYFRDILFTNPDKSFSLIYYIFKLNFAILIMNILLGLIGVGYYTYPTEKLGFKGFFYAGNELAGIISIFFPFFLFIVFYKKTKLMYLVFALFLVFVSALIGTKSALLISVISSFTIPYMYGSQKERRIVTVTLIFIFVIVSFFLAHEEIEMIDRMIFFYEKGGLAYLLLSSRDEYWIERSREFFEGSFGVQLLGLGGNRTIEMDPFDTLVNYGYLGVMIVYSVIFFFIYRSFKCRNQIIFGKVIFFSNILILLISTLAGHIYYSAMSSLFIAVLNSLTYSKLKSLSNNN